MILCCFVLLCLAVGAWKRVPVYDRFAEGAKEGLRTAVQILPGLMVMLSCIRAMETSGLMAAFCSFMQPVTERMGIPSELLPFMLLRPLSGSGALAMLKQLMETHGPDSRISLLAGVMMGSSETVFYTVSVYLAAAGVKKTRHILPCALLSCLAGYAGAFWFCP